MDAIARARNVDLVELHPPFPTGSPRSRRTAVPPATDNPQVRAVECAPSVQIVGDRLLGPEGHSRYPLGQHRSNFSVPVTGGRPWHPCRPARGVRHRARGCAGTPGVGAKSWEVVVGEGLAAHVPDTSLLTAHDNSPKRYEHNGQVKAYPFHDFRWRALLPELQGIREDLAGAPSSHVRIL